MNDRKRFSMYSPASRRALLRAGALGGVGALVSQLLNSGIGRAEPSAAGSLKYISTITRR